MTTIRFDEATVKATRKGLCPSCGRTATRSRTFARTISPFNQHPDGTPKTAHEVYADVRADADAWAPDPDLFEHEACLLARNARPAAEPEPLCRDAEVRAAQLRNRLVQAHTFLIDTMLPAPHLSLYVHDHGVGGPKIEVGFVQPGEFLLWCRTVAADTVSVDSQDSCTAVRLRFVWDDVTWKVHASVPRPNLGDRLGDAAVEWRRDRHDRKSGFGTVTVDELAAGLARLGIAELTHPASATRVNVTEQCSQNSAVTS